MISLGHFVVKNLPMTEGTKTDDRLRRIVAHYNSWPVTETTRDEIASKIKSVVRDLYARGGYVIDRDDAPILNVKDVAVVVNVGIMTDVSAVRSVASMVEQVKSAERIAAILASPR